MRTYTDFFKSRTVSFCGPENPAGLSIVSRLDFGRGIPFSRLEIIYCSGLGIPLVANGQVVLINGTIIVITTIAHTLLIVEM